MQRPDPAVGNRLGQQPGLIVCDSSEKDHTIISEFG
jgi:hypothetical protein